MSIRVETVDLDGARFDATELALVEAGLCCWQTAYGLPWSEHCETPLSAAERQAGCIYCAEHEEAITTDWPGQAVPRTSPRQ